MRRATGRLQACALALALGLAAWPWGVPAQSLPRSGGAASPQGLPTLGDTEGLTMGAERRLGERIARELFRDPDYLDDPVLGDYVQQLWLPLLAAARQRGELAPEMDERFAWRILLGRDRTINAFALPGGWLGLHLGLISATASRDEVAAVLAHELSHVTQRHIARMMTQDSRVSPLVMGAMILGAAMATRNPAVGQAVMTGGQAAAVRSQLNFSRDMEREADRVGFGVLTQAGFEPAGAAAMFEKLQQASRLNDDGSFPYLRTHPLTTERIADMRARLPLAAPSASTGTARPDLLHGLVSARAKVLAAPGVDGLRVLVREAQALPANASLARQAVALYGAALAAHKLGDAPLALRLQTRLAGLALDDPSASRLVRLLGGELALAAGDSAGALAAAGMRPTARPELLLTALAQLRVAQGGGGSTGSGPTGASAPASADALDAAAQAADRLQSWLLDHPSDATAWQLLAQAQTARGLPLRALRAEAEARVAVLDYSAAMDRLRAAQNLARRGTTDHIEASIIDARARQVELLLREQAAER